jgi:3-dehydroquinate dehydratase/shikimate dehydrogenase
MKRPLVCLTLTGKTLSENIATIENYRKYIDLVELRVDFLDENERLYIRNFPAMAGLPCILTIRRKIDGGRFVEGESSRTVLFARAMAFAEENRSKNFAYVDFEEDFHVPSLQDSALAFGTRVIRSVHDMQNPILDISSRLASLRTTGYEIPKIAFMPKTLSDVTNLFQQAKKFGESEQILCAMGPLGLPSRILSAKINSYLTYTSPVEASARLQTLGHLDPITLSDIYHFQSISDSTKVFGITGWPLNSTLSPALHNKGFEKHNIDAVYVPIRSESVDDAIEFCNEVGVKGLSVTIPHKENVLADLREVSSQVGEIGACNTILNKGDYWIGDNTDALGFSRSLLEFTGTKNIKHWKVALIGAGGAAKAVAYALKTLGAKVCVFNRTASRAKKLAEQFGFKWALLTPENEYMIEKYSDLIVQTTSVGMGSSSPSSSENDPIYFYDFKGHEMVFDIIYVPETTPIMARAEKAGCRVQNGFPMLQYQGYRQFELFTGEKYD